MNLLMKVSFVIPMKNTRKTVMKLLNKYEVELDNLKEIEDCIRYYFLDKMNVYDCAKAIRDNI